MKKSILFASAILAGAVLFTACDDSTGNGNEKPEVSALVKTVEGTYNVADQDEVEASIVITGVEKNTIKFELKDYTVEEEKMSFVAEFDIAGETGAVTIDWKGDFISGEATYAGEVKGSINKHVVEGKSTAPVDINDVQDLNLNIKIAIDEETTLDLDFTNEVEEVEVPTLVESIVGTYEVTAEELEATIVIAAVEGEDNEDKVELTFTYDGKTYVAEVAVEDENADGIVNINDEAVTFAEGENNHAGSKVVGTITVGEEDNLVEIKIVITDVVDATFTNAVEPENGGEENGGEETEE